MKLSFSTVACPQWSWGEILASAADLGFQGVELRGLGQDLFLPNLRLFAPEHIAQTRADLKRHRLELSCLASDVCLNLEDRDYTAAGRLYVAAAANIGAPYVRVLGDCGPEPGVDVREDLVFERLRALTPMAQACGVTLLVETNGIYADTARLARLIRAADSPAVQVLWDVNHPVRFFGETPEQSFANIGAYVRHVHVKDSVMENGRIQYKMLGYGDLPLKTCVALLKAAGYEGYLSLEWVKRWNDDLEDAGIVLPHFAHAARGLLAD